MHLRVQNPNLLNKFQKKTFTNTVKIISEDYDRCCNASGIRYITELIFKRCREMIQLKVNFKL